LFYEIDIVWNDVTARSLAFSLAP